MKYKYLATALACAVASPSLAATVSVLTDPTAPDSNFSMPTNRALAGYDLTLSSDGSNVVAKIVQTGGTSAGAFANLYFDINPSVANGSDLGFEMGGSGVTAFIPGRNGQPGFNTTIGAAFYTFTSSTVGGLTTIDLSLANSLFTAPIAGLIYYPGQTFEDNVTLRLSQSLSYSVAGGASYGVDRLGNVSVANVPEPATWGMMITGFGGIGFAMRRRAKVTVRFA